MKRWLAVCVVVVLAGGCGEKKESNSDQVDRSGRPATSGGGKAAPEVVTAKAWDPALGTATIEGVVKFEGKPPKQRAIDTGGKAECAKHATPLVDETFVVGQDGALKNTLVYVKTGLRGWKFAPPEKPVTLDQKGCRFEPHVIGVEVNQPLEIRNSDEFAHNVHSMSTLNTGFNFTQPGSGTVDVKKFSQREIAFRMKCDIHGWMSNWVAVVEHPFFAVTGADGKFVLKGLPKGDFVLEAWHEDLGTKTEKLSLGDKDSKTVEFKYAR